MGQKSKNIKIADKPSYTPMQSASGIRILLIRNVGVGVLSGGGHYTCVCFKSPTPQTPQQFDSTKGKPCTP